MKTKNNFLKDKLGKEKIIFVIVIFLISIFIISGIFADTDWWPMFRHDINHTGYSSSEVNMTNFGVIWIFNGSGNFTASPSIFNNLIYIGDTNGTFYALNATTGYQIWNYSLNGTITSSSSVEGNIVYFGGNDKIFYALNATNGSRIWSYNATGNISSSPVVELDKVYFGDGLGIFYALNATNGTQLWNYSSGDLNVIYSPPIIYGNLIFAGGEAGAFSLNKNDGSENWTKSIILKRSSPTFNDGVIYIGANYNGTYALNATNGNIIWAYDTSPYRCDSSPLWSNDSVYFACGNSTLYAVNATTGTQIWNYSVSNDIIPLSLQSSFSKSNFLFIGVASSSASGAFLFFNLSNSLIGQYSSISFQGTNPEQTASSPAISNGMVYIGSDSNKFYAFSNGATPVTTLNSPSANYVNDSSNLINVSFNCSATDETGNLANISLYITNPSNSSFALNKTTLVTGYSNETNWTLQLGTGNYTWNCLAYDDLLNLDWGDVNRSIKLNYTDTTYPLFSTYYDNNASLVGSGIALFNVTIANTNGTVYLNINGTSVLATNLTSNVYNASIFLLNGTYIYNWSAYGNGSSHNLNYSVQRSYTVNASIVSIYFSDNTPQNQTLAYGNALSYNINATSNINFSFFAVNDSRFKITTSLFNSTKAIGLLENNTLIGGGFYLLNITINDTSNNKNSTIMFVNVTKATQSITPLLNSLNSNLVVTYPQQINASYTGTNQTTLTISINSTQVTSSTNYTWGAGDYWIVNYSLPSNQNYSGNETFLNLTINKATGIVYTYLNNSRANITIVNGTSIYLNSSLNIGLGNIQLYKNDSLINNGSSVLSNLSLFDMLGLFNITSIYLGNENYTNSSETFFVTSCIPDCSAVASHCAGEVFSDGCTGTCTGTMSCPGPCFLAGTKILMSNGKYEDIEKIQVGEFVVSYDQLSNKNVNSFVEKTFVHNSDNYLLINNLLNVTPNHPVLINGNWNEIGKAKIGDELQLVNGSNVQVNLIKEIFDNVKTFNLQVADNHNYFANGILVHNKGETCTPNRSSDSCGTDNCGDSYNNCYSGKTCSNGQCVAPSCDASTCSSWESCLNGKQTRTCTDSDCSTSKDCSSSCNEATCSSWGICLSGKQARTCIDSSCSEEKTCTSSCDESTCGSWSSCLDGKQTRSCSSSGCLKEKSCISTCNEATCGSWGICLSGKQARTCIDNSCSKEKTCESVCDEETCSVWGSCANGKQTRTCTDILCLKEKTCLCQSNVQCTWTSCADVDEYSYPTCIDLNDCGIAIDVPAPTKCCTPNFDCTYTLCTGVEKYSYPQCNDLNNCDPNSPFTKPVTTGLPPVSCPCIGDNCKPCEGPDCPCIGDKCPKPCTVDCGTPPNEDKKPLNQVVVECLNWSECKPQYTSSSLLSNDLNVNGIQTRTCSLDKKPKLEFKPCNLISVIKLEKKDWCYDSTLEISENKTNSLVARLKISKNTQFSNFNNLNLFFKFGEMPEYCDYCYNGIKDHDEEKTDCGGLHCAQCIEVYEFFNWLYFARILIGIFSVILIFGCSILFIKENKDLISSFAEKIVEGNKSHKIKPLERDWHYQPWVHKPKIKKYFKPLPKSPQSNHGIINSLKNKFVHGNHNERAISNYKISSKIEDTIREIRRRGL